MLTFNHSFKLPESIKPLVIGLSLLFLTGCHLINDVRDYDYIEGFFLPQGSEDVVIITAGNNQSGPLAYRFEHHPQFKQALLLSREVDFGQIYSQLKMDSNGKITGSFKLTRLAERPTEKELAIEGKLSAAGFATTQGWGYNFLEWNQEFQLLGQVHPIDVGGSKQLYQQLSKHSLEEPIRIDYFRAAKMGDIGKRVTLFPAEVVEGVVIVPLVLGMLVFATGA